MLEVEQAWPGRGTDVEPRVTTLRHAATVSVVLDTAPGLRVVGMPVRARNARVLARAGTTAIEAAALGALDPEGSVLLLPSTLAINAELFARLPDPQRGPCRIGPEAGPYAWFGSARDIAPIAPAYFQGEPRPDGEPLSLVALDQRAVLSVRTPRQALQATSALLRQAAKATDGFVARTLNRRISRFFSHLFLAARLRPEHATAVNLALGLGSAYLLAQTGALSLACAGLLFQFASAFDGVDGEMARTTLSESPRGAWLDTAVDTCTYATCLCGVTIGWAREGMGSSGLWLGAGLVCSVAATLVVLMRFVHRYGPDGSLVFVDRCVERAAQDSGRLSLRVARGLFHLLRRDVFSMLFFLLSLSGSRSLIPMVVTAGALLSLAALVVHRSELLAAARVLSPRA